MIAPSMNLLNAIAKRQAVAAIGASAARGQGASGVVTAIREALCRVPLATFGVDDEARFVRQLDRITESVRKNLPRRAASWGLARKCLNIYLRDCFYNIYLNNHFELAKAESFFEVPLDSVVAKGLKSRRGRGELPRWPGVKNLKPTVSNEFQKAALDLSRTWGISRVHLDTYLWVEGR